MCAEWVGLYNDLNNINNPDNIPSMKSLVNAIEKLRNNEGKSFLRDLSKNSNQENNQLNVIDKAIRTGNWDDEALDELDNLNNDDYGRILKRFSYEELRSSDEVLKQAETIVSRGNGSSSTSNTSSQQERIKQQEIQVETWAKENGVWYNTYQESKDRSLEGVIEADGGIFSDRSLSLLDA